MQYKVCGLVVTYNPDIALFEKVIISLGKQVDKVIVVDNFSNNRSEIQHLLQKSEIQLIELPKNTGIGHAQNQGIAYAQKHLADYVLLMDQDTVLPEKSIPDLLQQCISLEKEGSKIGAIGYAYHNTHDGQLNSVWKAQGLKLEKQYTDSKQKGLVEADFIIASGSLIPIQTLKNIGGMEEGLFIDLVDVEWGLRARARGYKNYTSYNHIMTHTLGREQKKFLWKNVTIHNPINNYYSIRNSIFLAKRPYVGWAWRLYYLRRIFLYFITFSVLPDQKWVRIKRMVQGLRDGMFNRSGSIVK